MRGTVGAEATVGGDEATAGRPERLVAEQNQYSREGGVERRSRW
jgi:hypothetical protein